MKRCAVILLLCLLALTACAAQPQGTVEDKETEKEMVCLNITAEEAKEIMDTQEGYIILDVRTREEYEVGHIPGAILIPNDELEEKAAQMLPDKDQLILVYCRSGRRSKLAAEVLTELGYTNIREFGGIIDWPYEVE